MPVGCHLGEKTLSFSRLSRQSLNEQPLGLTDLVHQVLGDLRTAHVGRRVDLMPGDLPVCRAAVALLKQILINLLSSAIKFTSKGEVASIEVGCQHIGRGLAVCRRIEGGEHGSSTDVGEEIPIGDVAAHVAHPPL
jgi:signal transduction histidine kinase